MKPPIILCDIDGVLANWNDAFLHLLNGMTGQNKKFPEGEPTIWAWPQHELGFTAKQVQDAWRLIDAEMGYFWQWDIAPLAGARAALERLDQLDRSGNAEVYFVTDRQSQCARWRTAQWLVAEGYLQPSVIVTHRKGDVAGVFTGDRRLIVIDDKPENLGLCAGWADAQYLIDHLYNRWCESPEVMRVGSVVEALEMEFKRKGTEVAA